MIGFYCATPYHIFVSLHLSVTKYKDKKKNIMIMNHFSYATELAKKLQETGVFEHVYILNQNTKTAKEKAVRLAGGFIADKSVREFANFEYEELLFLALDFMNYAYIIKKLGSNTKYAYVEDGIGTYFRDDIYEPSKAADIVLKLQNKKKYLSQIKLVYVFKPEMMIGNCGGYEIQSIDPIDKENQEFVTLVKNLWGDNKIEDFRVVYMEQPYKDVLGSEYDVEERILFDIVEEYFDQKDIILRMHPRSKGKFIDKRRDTNEAPYEVGLLDYDIDKKVIVSTFSTVCLTPKMIYNQEPVIVFTYKLYPSFIQNYKDMDKVYELVNALRSQYKDKQRIKEPNNVEEYRKILHELKGEIHDK